MTTLAGRRVLLGMTGGIACYKACELVRRCTAEGAIVQVVMTAGARAFVTPLTLQALSGRPVATEIFDPVTEAAIGHIGLADDAEAVVVAPATANAIAKAAAGIADDLLGTILLATKAPQLWAPAMNVHMWEHPATRRNVDLLRERGAAVVGPEVGSLACGWEGAGRLADPASILEALRGLLSPHDLVGEHVLVSAGPTREAIDPVRYLSNRSSGKMGYAIARVARRRGAAVTLITGPTELPLPEGVDSVRVETAAEMGAALASAFPRATVLIMAAAVADYRPRRPAASKLKKHGPTLTLELERTADLLASLARRKGHRLVIGFAAETGEPTVEAQRKLRDKRLDLIVANDVTAPGAGFGADTNVVQLLEPDGRVQALPLMPKEAVAERILDWVSARRQRAAAPPAPRSVRRPRRARVARR